MIKNVQIYGLEESVRASKFPMAIDTDLCNDDITATVNSLAQAERGSGHDNFLNGIIVQFDLTFTIKAWTEMERYHFMDFVSSQSTMHKITKFNLNKAYNKYVDPRIIKIMKDKVVYYNTLAKIDRNTLSYEAIESLKEELNELYLQILYSNPCGMGLTARMTTNYRQLKTIYAQRKNHRLPEWREFCKWVETLPHSEWITK